MIKGLIGSIISAAVFFTAGGITAAILGTNGSGRFTLFEDAGWSCDDYEMLLDSDEDGTWYFDNHPRIALGLAGTKAHIAPVDDDRVSLSVSDDSGTMIGFSRLYVQAAASSDGSCLGISVSRHTFGIMVSSDVTVKIGLPRDMYESFYLKVGSGTAELDGVSASESGIDIGSGKITAENMRAVNNNINIGSGKLSFTQDPNLTADSLSVAMGSGSADISSAAEHLGIHIGSGSLKMTTSHTEHFSIDMGSGYFKVNGLSGTGAIDVSSGSGSARFTDASRIDGSSFELSSGELDVYLPADTHAVINGSVSSGSFAVDCCGVNKKLRDDEQVVLNGGGAEISADVSSGKLSILENNEVTDHSDVVEEQAVVTGIEIHSEAYR